MFMCRFFYIYVFSLLSERTCRMWSLAKQVGAKAQRKTFVVAIRKWQTIPNSIPSVLNPGMALCEYIVQCTRTCYYKMYDSHLPNHFSLGCKDSLLLLLLATHSCRVIVQPEHIYTFTCGNAPIVNAIAIARDSWNKKKVMPAQPTQLINYSYLTVRLKILDKLTIVSGEC